MKGSPNVGSGRVAAGSIGGRPSHAPRNISAVTVRRPDLSATTPTNVPSQVSRSIPTGVGQMTLPSAGRAYLNIPLNYT